MKRIVPLAQRLLEIIHRFKNCPIAVYGDLVADEFVFGEISRISREAPVLILKHRESEIVPGGAANAVNNLSALGARPIPVGIIGDDMSGRELLRMFREKGIPSSQVQTVTGYTTPTKTRILAGTAHSSRQQVLRVDRESRFQHNSGTCAALNSRLEKLLKRCRGMIISDYGFGYVNCEVVDQIAPFRRALPIILDSRFRLLQYANLTAATPNEPEVEEALGIRIGNDLPRLEYSGRTLLKKQKLQAVLITRGRDGMALFQPRRRTVHIPIYGTDEIADVTGAGDTVIAVFTLSLAAGASFHEAATLSNYAGGIVVMKSGTATVSADELLEAVGTDMTERSG
jgi:D-glycero-beta-D-manno-heptose-7-phosphate kinase